MVPFQHAVCKRRHLVLREVDCGVDLFKNKVAHAKWKQLWADFNGDYAKLAKSALGWTQAWECDMNAIHPQITSTVAK